jgi:hypothetical protein
VSFIYEIEFTQSMGQVHLSVSVLFVTYFDVKVKVNVKCTLVQALRLCTGRVAHRGSRVIALPFHDHRTRRG